MLEFLKGFLSERTITALVEKLGEDVVKQIDEKAKDFKIDVAEEKLIPKSKFDEVNNEKNEYKKQLGERDSQLATLQEKAKGNEELTKQIESLKTQNTKQAEEFQSKMAEREREFLLNEELSKAKTKNTKAVKALLDNEKIVLKDGKFEGLNEQIEALKKSDSYLFELGPEKDGIGKTPGGGKTPPSGLEDQFAKFRKIK